MSNDLLDTVGGKPTPDGTPKDTPENKEDYLVKLVGEGKPFKDVNVLAKAKLDSDNFIKQIQQENKELRDSLKETEAKANRNIAIDDILNEVRKVGSREEGDNQPALTEADISKILEAKINEMDRGKTAVANREKVNTALRAKFSGDDSAATKFLNERVSKVGLDKTMVKALAENSPEAFIELLGINAKPRMTDPSVRGGVNTEQFNNVNADGNTRNLKYYEELRKKMGMAKYYSNHELQRQKFEDQTKLGDAFFN